MYSVLTEAYTNAGGWFEYLTRCRLNKKKFVQKEEMLKMNHDAAESAMSSVLETAIAAAHLHKDARTAIKETVSAQMRDNLLPDAQAIEQAVSKASEEWKKDEEQMLPSVKDLADKLGFDITGDENMLTKTCGRAVALWRPLRITPGEFIQERARNAILSALEELVPDLLMAHVETGPKDRCVLLEEEAKALGTRVVSPKLRAQEPVRLSEACEEAISEWTDLVKAVQDRLRPAENEQVTKQAPALIALEIVVQEQRSEWLKIMHAKVQDVRAVLEAAATEEEALNATNLLALAREVPAERKRQGRRDESPGSIPKVVVRKFCLPAAIRRAADAAELKLKLTQ